MSEAISKHAEKDSRIVMPFGLGRRRTRSCAIVPRGLREFP